MLTTSTTLLDQLRRPDAADAWAQFNHLYRPILMGWVTARGFQEADADEVVQDVLTKLFKEMPGYRREPGQTFRGWLYTLAVRQCVDFRRRRGTRPLGEPDGLSGVPAADAPPALDEAEEAAYRLTLARGALAAICGDFEPQTWAAFTGVVLDGRPAADVAAGLGMRVNAVYVARNRVLTRLRAHLDGLLD